ncbi:hypothetical protein ACNSOL_11905 (plasmid) [Aliarcobacter lanthieri]|uniref:hypothetical protein n=1 Tax=Aliarcobacter lanthieri TaxID=1355374 RepID=UPI003AAB18D5
MFEYLFKFIKARVFNNTKPIEEKKQFILKSKSQIEERNYLLKKTSQAYNSSIILNHLRGEVRKYKVLQKGKLLSKGHIYLDQSINEISDIIYEYAPNTKYWKIAIRRILKDMDDCNFKEQPSMNRVHNDYLNFFKDEIEDKLNCYESINLSRHTLNLLKVYQYYFKGDITYINHSSFEIIMSCLLHDFGKSKKLQQNICKSDDYTVKHQIVSGWYIYRIIEELKKEYIFQVGDKDEDFIFGQEELLKIRIAVINHHNDVDKGSLAEVLKLIDHKTREMEYLEYGRKRNKFTTGKSVIEI